MPDNCVQCALSAGANWVQRRASSPRALSSSAAQVPGASGITSEAPRQLAGISNFGTPPAGPRASARDTPVVVRAAPLTSAETLAQAAIRNSLCAPRTRQDACCSVGNVAGARLGPQ